jgi:hypothetical protein
MYQMNNIPSLGCTNKDIFFLGFVECNIDVERFSSLVILRTIEISGDEGDDKIEKNGTTCPERATRFT